MSNFDFLKDFDTTLWKLGNRIEKEVNISPSGVKADATTFLEYILKRYLDSVNIIYNSHKPFKEQMDSVYRANGIQYGFKEKIKSAYDKRNQIHDDFEDIEKNEYVTALELHKKLFYIAKKYYRDSDEYDEYKGVPAYKAPEIDLTDDEIELLEIPDFDEVIEFTYDYCVICGEPNHSNYSIFCEKCNRDIDNANNFISIRNSFGKDSKFTKEDLIEYGIHEGYVNALISSLNKSNLFKVKGRFIEFNNSQLDSYISKIDMYIKIGELITQFREEKITPKEIKETKEYKQGSFKQFPFYQFYKVINEEIITIFEKDLLSAENIQNSIEYTTIGHKQLNRWYNIQLNQYNKNNINESFVVFNNLLIEDYLDLRRQGIKEKDIQKKLNISKEILEFFPKFKENFTQELDEIKKDLLLEALSDNKSRLEAIELAGITQKEYDDIIKYSKFKENEFGKEYEKIVNERKESLLINLMSNDLTTSCALTKINVDDFYKWYDEAKIDSEFYIKSSKILMDKFLNERKSGKTKSQAAESIGLKENIINYWLKRKDKLFDEFQDKNLKVIIFLILDGFKKNKTKSQISRDVEVSVKKINTFLDLGRRKSKIYAELYDYYENDVIPRNLSKFLDEIKNKSLNKALNLSDLTIDELNYYYKENSDFHDKYLNFKIDTYVNEIISGRNHKTSLKRSNLSADEYNQYKQKLDELILNERMEIVKKEIANDSKTDVAAKRAGVTFDDIYDWYYKGKSDEKYEDFSQFFFSHYIEPNILWVNKLLNENYSVKRILKVFDINFIEKDFEIWQKEGLIKTEDIVVDLNREDEDEKISILESHNSRLYAHESKDNTFGTDDTNSELYKVMNNNIEEDDKINRKDIFKQKKASKTSSILKKDDEDIEKLKKEILRK